MKIATSMNSSNKKTWQTIAILAQELIALKADYNFRKSKLIRYRPTDRELREAGQLYKFALTLMDKKEKNAIELKKILDKVSPVIEDQIRYLGFIEELTRKYPTGIMSDEVFLDIAEKWDVLDHIVDTIITNMNIKLESITGAEYVKET